MKQTLTHRGTVRWRPMLDSNDSLTLPCRNDPQHGDMRGTNTSTVRDLQPMDSPVGKRWHSHSRRRRLRRESGCANREVTSWGGR
jgi:hypothetical protein